MTRVAEAARITFTDLKREGITLSSPLEDQAALVYRAARKYALANGFKPHTHRGVHGLAGHMTLKRIINSLFDGTEDELSRGGSLIGQVLRKTDAAVCLVNPRHGDPTNKKTMPTWFVADRMPTNLTIVSLGTTRKSAEAKVSTGLGGFDEDSYLRRNERKLTAEEAGETQPPGEVTVTQRTAEQRLAPLRESHERARREHERVRGLILEQVQTSPQPVSTPDLKVLLDRDGEKLHSTTIRACLAELETAGKVVSRKETPEEALVRGGGEMPRATRPILYAPAPGPVPTRTALPPGIEPQLSARRRWEVEMTKKATARLAVLEELERKYPRGEGKNRPRSPQRLAAHLGLAEDDVRQALADLVNDGKVYKGVSHAYFSEQDRRKPRSVPEPEPTPEPEGNGVVTAMPGVSASTSHTDDKRAARDKALLKDLAKRLGVTLEPDNYDVLKAELDTVRDENRRLREQVSSLKAAIRSLT